MTDLYSEKDFERISAQLKKRYLLLGCIMAVLLAVIVWSCIIRMEWLTVISTALFFSAAVFVIDLFCLPLHRYKSLLAAALNGRSRTETLEFECAEPDTSIVDGVPCRSLLFLDEPDKHGTREQRFYWDEEIPLPAFTAGDQVTLKYSDRNIIGYQL